MIRSLFSARALALALALGLSVTLLPAEPSSAAVQRVGKRFAGMTDSNPESWPKARVGSIRLWDTGVTWRQIETKPGSFDYTLLDRQVAAARANGARPLLVLGMTPEFHAKRRNDSGLYGDGSVSAPKMWAWKRYVRKVVTRYGGKMDYQVWNEANVNGFWSGTHAQMATLTKVTSKIVNANNRKAKVVAPAMATRLSGQRKWLRDFYSRRTGGRPVAGWVDVVSLNLYPLPKQKPEHSMTLLAAVRTQLRALRVRKPIWNTEINYGLQTGGGGTAKNISERKEAAYVGRTYVLNAANNVKRVFWYSWELQTMANTQLTKDDGDTLTRAGYAYKVVGDWQQGGRMQGCDRDRKGTYTCEVRSSSGVKRIYWNPTRRARVTLVKSAKKKSTMTGYTTRVRGGKRQVVNYSPIMVQSRR
jgi:hypothetical protein